MEHAFERIMLLQFQVDICSFRSTTLFSDSVNTRSLMNYAISLQVRSKHMREIFTSIISAQCFDKDTRLSLDFGMESTKVRK